MESGNPPRSRMTPKKLKAKSSQKEWNRRFWNEVVPMYSSEHVNHIKKNKPFDKSPLFKKSTYLAKAQKNRELEMTKEELLKVLQGILEQEWESQAIPSSQRSTYRTYVFTQAEDSLCREIMKEVELLKLSQSLSQMVLKGIQDREDCLGSLRDLNMKLKEAPGWEHNDEVKTECAELLHSLRMFTLNVVEAICKWREELLALATNISNFPAFEFNRQNYLIKAKYDTEFLRKSEFRKVFKFRKTCDPFFLALSGKHDKQPPSNQKKKYYLRKHEVVVPVLPAIIGRIKMAEFAMTEEELNNDFQHESSEGNDSISFHDPTPEISIVSVEFPVQNPTADSIEKERKPRIGRFSDIISLKAYQMCEKIQTSVLFMNMESRSVFESAIFPIVSLEEFEDVQDNQDLDEQVFLDHESQKFDEEDSQDHISQRSAEENQDHISQRSAEENQDHISQRSAEERSQDHVSEKSAEEENKELEIIASSMPSSKVPSKPSSKKSSSEDLSNEYSDKFSDKESEEKVPEEEEINLDEVYEQLAEEIIDQEIATLDPEYTKLALKLQNKQIIPDLLENLLEDIVSIDCADLSIKELVLPTFLLEKIFDSFEKETDEMLLTMAQEEIEFMRRANPEVLRRHILSENIYRIILEEIINEEKIDEMAEYFLKTLVRRKKRTVKETTLQDKFYNREQDMLLDKQANEIYLELIEEFISQDWISELSNSVYEFKPLLEVEDFAFEVFTPGIHSPNEYSAATSLDYDPTLIFLSKDELQSVKNVFFEPVYLPEDIIPGVLSEYFNFVPAELSNVTASFDVISLEIQKGADPCWYWAKTPEGIIGLVIYISDCSEGLNRITEVLHMSCVNFSVYPDFIKIVQELVWEKSACDEMRVNFYVPNNIPDMPKDIKNVYVGLKYRWKTYRILKKFGTGLNVMGIYRPASLKSQSEPIPFSIKNSCVISTAEHCSDSGPIQWQVSGNRQCLLNALYNSIAIEGIEYLPDRPLFAQIKDGLDQMNDNLFQNINNLVTDDKEKANEFLAKNEISHRFEACASISASVLNLSSRFVSCCFTYKRINGEQYHYLRIKSQLTQAFNPEGGQLFMIPSNLPSLSYFILTGPSLKKTLSKNLSSQDMFSKVQELMTSMSDFQPMYSSLWVPAFSVKAQWEEKWLRGFPVSSSSYVQSASFSLDIQIAPHRTAEGLLQINRSQGEILASGFIFGGLSESQFPLFVSYVSKKDWISFK